MVNALRASPIFATGIILAIIGTTLLLAAQQSFEVGTFIIRGNN